MWRQIALLLVLTCMCFACSRPASKLLPYKGTTGFEPFALEDSEKRKFLLSIPSEFKARKGLLAGEYLFVNELNDELSISVESRLEPGALTMFDKDATEADPARKGIQFDGATIHWNVLSTSRKDQKLSLGFWFRSPSAVAVKFRSKVNMEAKLKLILDSIRYDSTLQHDVEIERFVGQPITILPYNQKI